MKVLFASMRYDPHDPDQASGVEHNLLLSFKRLGMDVRVVGPFLKTAPLVERAIKRLYMKVSGRQYVKYTLASVWEASQAVKRNDKSWGPDVIVTTFPAPLDFYDGKTPCVFITDTTWGGYEEGTRQWEAQSAMPGNLALRFQKWEEKRVVKKSARVVTFSEWCKAEIVSRHGVEERKIEVLPIPSTLPMEYVPNQADIAAWKKLETPLRLLLVGRTYHRKGVDIAIEIVEQLNELKVPAQLTVCGLAGANTAHVKYVGIYKKSDPQQLRRYLDLYKEAHLLLHPARFEPAGIVPGEAAAYGTPTITNDVGGLATSVKHGRSGIVLPGHSPPEEYAKAIIDLVNDPGRYYELCQSARRRYEDELNWVAAQKRMKQILSDAVDEGQPELGSGSNLRKLSQSL